MTAVTSRPHTRGEEAGAVTCPSVSPSSALGMLFSLTGDTLLVGV